MKCSKVLMMVSLSLALGGATVSWVKAQGPALVQAGYFAKTYSQRTYTLFPDGHYERKTCYTDGSCDPLEQNMFHRPGHGDLKHREEVWRNGQWVPTVSQYY
jgi:hypothetical protein